ncbi:hypothetical protein V5799_023218 [Amblyomma americanum]|uniref:DDE Tnp4 domain-containing protein n=1 Tax=Amblyomma americanum TaxID=6943 RepID=A0AAQ4FIW9_AMBAM
MSHHGHVNWQPPETASSRLSRPRRLLRRLLITFIMSSEEVAALAALTDAVDRSEPVDSEDDDDDASVVLLLAAHVERQDRHRVPLYVERVVPTYLEFEFRKLFRISRCLCADLTGEFEASAFYPEGCRGRRQISAQKTMLAALTYIGTQTTMYQIADKFDVRGYLLGDAAYPLLPWLLPPYRHSTTNWQPWMAAFNNAHSRQRVVVEGSFGLLKARFQRLLYIDVARISQAVHIVLAACVLHNKARRCGDAMEILEDVDSGTNVSPTEPADDEEESAVSAGTLRDSVAQSLQS